MEELGKRINEKLDCLEEGAKDLKKMGELLKKLDSLKKENKA